MNSQLTVVQFNLLAPLWVSNLYKQLDCYKDFKDKNRYKAVIDYVNKQLPIADIYCLSEVSQEALKEIVNTFTGHDGLFVPNDPDYWHEWLAEDLQQTTPNGVAILVNPQKIKAQKTMSFAYGDGGYAAIFEGIVLSSGASIRIISVHLDVGDEKKRQIKKLLEYLASLKVTNITILSGDFNTAHLETFTALGFVETVQQKTINTIPGVMGVEGKIDHTLVLGNVKIFGKVYTIPHQNVNIAKRYCDTVKYNHSDHYATVSIIK